jgi:hypothetical protein
MRYSTVIVLALGTALVVTGCKSAKAGDACTGNPQCTGRQAALLCVSGKYVATGCKGPDGCMKSPFRCDYRGNAGGEACYEPASPASPMSCTPDKKARVRCAKGKLERDECDGPKGCSPRTETTMSCDRTLHAGSACSSDGDWCSSDGADWLQCREGKLVVAGKCRGPSHCRSLGDAIACDSSLGEPNDPCVGQTKACSGDGKSLLACRSNALVLDSTCPPGKTCRPSQDPACN